MKSSAARTIRSCLSPLSRYMRYTTASRSRSSVSSPARRRLICPPKPPSAFSRPANGLSDGPGLRAGAGPCPAGVCTRGAGLYKYFLLLYFLQIL